MPRFLAPITVDQEIVTGNETISGSETILGVTSGKESYWTSVSVQNGLSADYATFVHTVYASGGNSNQWNNAFTTATVYQTISSTYATLTGTQTLKNKTVVDWMTLVRGYNTTPTLLATITTGDVYTYIYNSASSNITYYRYIATDGTVDAFYTYFAGNTLSGLVASKSITI
jgi:hypothetical protein